MIKRTSHANSVIQKLTLFFLVFSIQLFSQAPPQFINYQGIVRNSTGVPVINQSVGVRFTIIETTPTGTVSNFTDIQSLQTNSLGLFSTHIGKNAVLTTVNWTNTPVSLEVAIDPAGGTSYTSMGLQQLVSVPFALYAQKAGNAITYSSSPNVTITTGNAIELTDKTALTPGIYGDVGTAQSKVPVFHVDQKGRLISAGEYTANVSGDIQGTLDNQTVKKLNGVPLAPTAPSSGQVLQFDGSNWTPSSIGAAGVTTIHTTGGIGGGPITSTGTISLLPTGVTPNSYGSAPNVIPSFSVDALGRIVSASTYTLNPPVIPGYIAGSNINITTAGTVNTISTPNHTLSFPNPSSIALTNGNYTSTAAIPQNTLSGSNGITVAGTGPTYTLSASTTGTNTLWNLLGNSGTNSTVNFLGTTDAADLNFRTANITRMKITSLGNVGITTPLAPTENLQIESGSQTRLSLISPASNPGSLWFGSTSSHSAGIIQYNNSTNEMNFGTSGALSRMRLFGNGDVAFGSTITANPVSSFANFCKQGPNDTKVLISGGDNSNTWGGILAFGENQTASQGMTIKLDAGSNKLLITTDVNGFSPVVGIGGYSGTTNGVMIGSAYAYGNSPVEGLAVQGNVGIGTSSPTEKLEVAGNVKIPGSNDYLYSSPKQKYLSVPVNALQSMRPQVYELYLNTYVAGYDGESGYAYFNNGTTGADAIATAPVYLPDGAVVNELWVRYYDGDPGSDLTVSLERKDHGSINNTPMASHTSSGNASSPS